MPNWDKTMEVTGTLTLDITLGDDAMQTIDDVADALERTARNMRSLGVAATAGIRYRNGHTCGSWSLNATLPKPTTP